MPSAHSKPAQKSNTLYRSALVIKKAAAGGKAGSTKSIARVLECSVSSVKRDLRYARMHDGEPRPSFQGQGKTDDKRWIFSGPNGTMNLEKLREVKEAGDAEDLLKEVWVEFLKHSPETPAYRTLCNAVAILQYTRKLLSSMARERDQHARDNFLHRVQLKHPNPKQYVFVDEMALFRSITT